MDNTTDYQEPKVVKKCTLCQKYILDGSYATILNGYPICKECCKKAMDRGLSLLSRLKK